MMPDSTYGRYHFRVYHYAFRRTAAYGRPRVNRRTGMNIDFRSGSSAIDYGSSRENH